MAGGQVAGSDQDFLTGFELAQGGDVWGRPVAAAVGPDGALYVTDDRAGAIYRIVPTAP
jgi:glucose/arabinose dehydrogenase